MSALFEELDYCQTPIGPVSLRRRRILSIDQDVFEVLLGDEHLMSSLFTASELALAELGLAALEGDDLSVIVGGLGLGYTAGRTLEDERVCSLDVIEFLEPVIEWHQKGLVPIEPPLVSDSRCRLVQGDFFKLAMSEAGFDQGKAYDAILIDIDHTPDWHLGPGSSGFYSSSGFTTLSRHVKPGGVVGLWSDALADDGITALLSEVFGSAWAAPVTFQNPLQNNRPFTQTVYLAKKTI